MCGFFRDVLDKHRQGDEKQEVCLTMILTFHILDENFCDRKQIKLQHLSPQNWLVRYSFAVVVLDAMISVCGSACMVFNK